MAAIIDQLKKSKNNFEINKPSSSGGRAGNITTPLDPIAAGNGIGSSAIISYNPNEWDRNGVDWRDPFIGLAHELVHARDMDNGESDQSPDSDGVPKGEDSAVAGENGCRAAGGYLPRLKY
ncbi:MAG TPA: M91 family zinc metallopeptidase [Candidatus Limnocylindria bacterium]|nr:M91 family zinc metallopeptidase [Candidatus Limnocylindria bacterium]